MIVHYPASWESDHGNDGCSRTATFEIRPDTTDQTVIDEVWDERVYVTHQDELEGKRVLDIGANIGAFSVLAAKLGAISVVAVEPQPDNHKLLKLNVGYNDVGYMVECHQFAVGEYASTVLIVDEGGAAHTEHVGTSSQWGVAHQVDQVGFVDLIESFGPFDLVKIDVEGAEWEFLRNIGDIADQVGAMIIEHHGPQMIDGMDAHVHLTEFRRTISVLAEYGSIQLLGRPSLGGTLRWQSYTPPTKEQ